MVRLEQFRSTNYKPVGGGGGRKKRLVNELLQVQTYVHIRQIQIRFQNHPWRITIYTDKLFFFFSVFDLLYLPCKTVHIIIIYVRTYPTADRGVRASFSFSYFTLPFFLSFLPRKSPSIVKNSPPRTTEHAAHRGKFFQLDVTLRDLAFTRAPIS